MSLWLCHLSLPTSQYPGREDRKQNCFLVLSIGDNYKVVLYWLGALTGPVIDSDLQIETREQNLPVKIRDESFY